MGLTRAERHNRMLDRVFNQWRAHQASIPPVELYSRYLELAVEKLGITKDEARDRYGLYTVAQWRELLGLNTFK